MKTKKEIEKKFWKKIIRIWHKDGDFEQVYFEIEEYFKKNKN